MLKWAVHEAKTSYLPDTKQHQQQQQLQEQKENDYDLYETTHALFPSRANSLIELNAAAIYSSATKSQLKRKTSDALLLGRRRQSLQFLGSSNHFCSNSHNANNNNNNHNNNEPSKRNQITSTPLNDASTHYFRGDHNNASLRKLNSLKDLSNIVPECTAHNTSVDRALARRSQEQRRLPKTPEHAASENSGSCRPATQHAPTLPTFSVEYSPNGLIPGPILAMRGLGGIADQYFEKPRYIDHMSTWNVPKFVEASNAQETTTCGLKTNDRHPGCVDVIGGADREEIVSLSSSQMSDSALEKMIDAIIASTRKERKLPRLSRQLSHNNNNNNFYTMSPTYKSAYDPANDLHEFWHEDTQVQRPRKLFTFNEREVRSPKTSLGLKRDINLHLRRQRAVRRKRRNAKIRQTLKNALQVTLESKPLLSTIPATPGNALKPQEPPSQVAIGNLSPDSGHNSSNSDSCILEEQNTLRACAGEVDLKTERRWKEPDLRLGFR